MPDIENVFVVIVSWNSLVDLRDCLPSVVSQTFPASRIVISDNDSSDGTVAWVRETYPPIEIIQNESNLGFAEGANKGIDYALANGADAVMLLNPDTKVDNNSIKYLVETANSQRNVGAVQAKIYLQMERRPPILNSIGNEIHYLGFGMCGGLNTPDEGQFEDDRQIPFASGAAVLFPRAALQRSGVFDPHFFMYCEDLDLGLRMRIAGLDCWLSARAIVHHDYHFKKGSRKWYYLERNRWLVILRTYSVSSIMLLLPAFVVAEIGVIAKSIKDGWFTEKLQAYKDIWLLRSHLHSQRREIQRTRAVSDRSLFTWLVDELEDPESKRSPMLSTANLFFRAYWSFIQRILGNKQIRSRTK